MRESGFLRAEQVMKEMQISRQKAYKIIRQLNEELAGMGYITVQGRVNADYFYERCRYHDGKETIVIMAVYKDEAKGTWRVIYRYTDWTGKPKQTQKRGFKTKREAQQWEWETMLKKESKLDMTFASFCELYEADRKPRLKASTWETKDHMIRTKLLPYFGHRKIAEIDAKEVIAWQNKLMAYRDKDGKGYSPDYLRSVHAQLSAIFNHAVKYYKLPVNPARVAGTLGKEIPKEMDFWTKEEYLKFAEAVMDKPVSYYAFEMLYWTGIREGELLALTPADFDFKTQTVTISKTYHRMKGKDIVTSPKTAKSNRTIKMPEFLCEEMQDYLRQLYQVHPDERIFPVTKYYLNHEMVRGCKASGVKKIRVHDIRHSHVSLLINMGFSALAIGERVGHEAEKITYRYAHLFPTVQTEMADRLNDARVLDTKEENSKGRQRRCRRESWMNTATGGARQ